MHDFWEQNEHKTSNVMRSVTIMYFFETMSGMISQSNSKRLAKMIWLAKFWKKFSKTLFQQTSYLPTSYTD
jgi:hypothetical protein